jgi:hypothetical protein
MRRTVIALLLLLSGAAASAVGEPANQNWSAQALQRGRCAVGVVSHLGEKFRVEKGILSERKISEVSVEPWHLDDLVVGRIRSAVGNRAAVQRIPYRKEAWVKRTVLLRQYPDYAATMRALAAGTRCARYVLVIPGRRSLGPDSGTLDGLAIGKGLGLELYAVIEVAVFDGETFKFNSRVTYNTKQSFPGIFGTAHPERLLNESFWPDPPNTAAQNTKLREATRELVARDLDEILPGLLLTR